MKWTPLLFSLLMLTTVFAVLVESGDGGVQFARDKAQEMCQEENVQAVYHCLGNVVRVVWAVEGQGSTFYKPDGRVIQCPVASPAEIGAECIQMMTPNYCPEQAECGAAPIQVFPGQNDAAEQSSDLDYYIVEEETEEVVLPEPEESEEPEPVIAEPPIKKPEPARNDEEIHITENNIDSMLGDLTTVILVLGVVSLIVLFLLFKKSINE